MKVLLDHNLDWRLARYLPGHEVKTTVKMGWDTLENGALLSAAEAEGFAVFVTGDTSVNYQQNFSFRSISVVILRAFDNRRKTHISMMPDVLAAITAIKAGEVVEVLHEDLKRKQGSDTTD